MITVALPKGGLLKDAVNLFKTVGLDFSEFLDASNRKLQITDRSGQAQALLVRTHDVPVYVEYGQAQLGIAGYDVIREKKPSIAELVDLKFGGCRLSVAVKADSPYSSSLDLPPHCRVASKFVNCAQEHFRDLDLPVEIIPLYGSVELGPITAMAEAIVDLVSTGNTLKQNGLVETNILFQSTARLVAHPLSYRVNRDNIAQWVERVRTAVG